MVPFKVARLTLSLFIAFRFTSAILPDGRFNANQMRKPAPPRVQVPADWPVTSRNGTQLPPYDTVYYFDQLIDHNNPELGTFQQRYWHTYEFYEPGGYNSVAVLLVYLD
jgi:hypothetical protein